MTVVIFQLKMKEKTQKRAIKTRQRLIETSIRMVKESGYEALRIEELVRSTEVAKGTFFSHFKNKEDLMNLLISLKIHSILDQLTLIQPPQTVNQMIRNLMPLLSFMSSEHYVFDVIFRCCGASSETEIGPIASSLIRLEKIVSKWILEGDYRKDITPQIAAEGIEAFLMQSLALNFCAENSYLALEQRFSIYLKAWLTPTKDSQGQ